MTRDESNGLTASVLDGDEVQGVLSGAFYAADARSEVAPQARATREPQEKPQHYKVICISMYTKDLTQLDALVDELKARGVTKASRSALIRAALEQVDLDRIPRGM
jgi:hypothetical protein